MRLRRGRHARTSHLANDTARSSLIQVLRLFASLGTFVAFRTTIGESKYGVFAGVQGLVVLATLLGCFWLPQLVLQRVLRDGMPVRAMAARAFSLGTAGGAVTIAVVLASGHVFLRSVSTTSLLCLGLAEVTAAVIVETPASLLQTQRGFAAASNLRITTPICRLVAVVLAIVTSVRTLDRFAVMIMATLLPVALLRASAVLRELGLRPSFGRVMHSDVVAGLSYSSIGGLYVVQDDGDKTMLVSAGFLADAAAYAAAYRVFQIALFPVNAFVTATHARFLQFGPDDPPAARVRRAVRFASPTLAYAVVAAAAIWLLAEPLAIVMGIRGQATIFHWLCLLLPLRCTAEFALNGILGLGRNWLRVAIVGVSGAVNVGVNLAFIPSHGWQAAAVATLLADSVLTGLAWVALLAVASRRPVAPRLARAAAESGELVIEPVERRPVSTPARGWRSSTSRRTRR